MQHLHTTPLAQSWDVWHTPFSASGSVPAEPTGATYRTALPMDARTLMARHGVVGNPHQGRQSRGSDWVTTREWVWRTHFTAPTLAAGERLYLRTRGVDYLAEYFLNGALVGRSASFNQVDDHDLTAALLPGATNELLVRLWPVPPEEVPADLPAALRGPLSPPPSTPADFDAIPELAPLLKKRDRTLKLTMAYGGDHNPFLITCGFALAPQLIVARGALVQHLRHDYTLDTTAGTASGAFRCLTSAWGEVDYTLTLAPANFAGKPVTYSGRWAAGDGWKEVPFSALPVQLWWPFHLGAPHAYELTLRVGGQVVRALVGFRSFARRDNGAFRAGPVASIHDWHAYENNGPYGQEYYKGYDAIREAGETWPERPREGNYALTHVVNGHDLFIMGGAVVPPTLLWADWDADYQRRLVREARQAQHNMLRVWGGGYLADEAFFEEATLQGVMITHDFLNFAAFSDFSLSHQQAREREFRSVIRQLNAQPAVVVMNGGNELLQMRQNRPLNPVFQCMTRVMRDETSNQWWHFSSPVNPEVHGPWLFDLDHAARYASQKTPFNSECGVLAAPALASMERVMAPGEIADLFGSAWRHRQPCVGYFDHLIDYTEYFGPRASATPQDVVRHTQWVQAMGYQHLIEASRRQQPRMIGFTTWEYNEPWLDFNWGVLDTYLVRKHAFYTWRRAAASAHLAADFGGYIYAPGSQFRATLELHATALAPLRLRSGSARLVDEHGHELARLALPAASTGTVAVLGTLSAAAPARGAFFLALRGELEDGTPLRNDYAFAVLPPAARPAVKALFISGGCYESGSIHAYAAAAGLQLTDVHASPDRPLSAEVDPAAYQVVILGPIFNPLRSLGGHFLVRLHAVVHAGTGLLYFPFNSSAYLAGRYSVDDLRGSALEALLPVTFPPDYYRNSEDPVPSGGPFAPVQPNHPVWQGLPGGTWPSLGTRVAVTARPAASVLGTEAGEAVLTTWQVGRGRITCFTGPYGSTNYAGVGFRRWLGTPRLLNNLIAYTATGQVGTPDDALHPLAPLAALPPATVTATARATTNAPAMRGWEVTLSNAGTVLALYVEIGHAGGGAAAQQCDWHADDSFIVLLPGETRQVAVRAVAHPGHHVPAALVPTISGWNVVAKVL